MLVVVQKVKALATNPEVLSSVSRMFIMNGRLWQFVLWHPYAHTRYCNTNTYIYNFINYFDGFIYAILGLFPWLPPLAPSVLMCLRVFYMHHLCDGDEMHVLCKNKNSSCLNLWVICLAVIFIHLLKLKNYLRMLYLNTLDLHYSYFTLFSSFCIFPANPFQSCDLFHLSLLYIHLIYTHNLSYVALNWHVCRADHLRLR